MVGIVALVVLVAVVAGLISLFVVAIRGRRWLLLCFGLLIVAGIAWLAWTSGIRSRDWVDGIIYAEGKNAVLVIDGCEVVLEGVPWSTGEMEFTMQVSGWTTSASAPRPDVYISYSGGGENKVTINQTRLKLRASGREILIGDTFKRLEPDQRLRVPATGPR